MRPWIPILLATVATTAAGQEGTATRPTQAPAGAPAAATAMAPDAGDPAPPFSLPGSDGQSYSLASFAGKKAVVLAWFPKAFTGG